MRTVTGKGSLEDPVNGEDSLEVEQLDYFEKVLENSMATAEVRFEQLRRVGCGAARRMPTVTGSTAAVKGWTATQGSSLGRTAHERSSMSFVPRITSNATVTRNVMVKCSRKHSRQAIGQGCESPCALRKHHEVRQAIGDEPCQEHRSTSMKSFRRGVQCRQYTGCVSRKHQAKGLKHAQSHRTVMSRGSS